MTTVDVGVIVKETGVNLRKLEAASGVDYDTLKSISSGRLTGQAQRAAIAGGLRKLAGVYVEAADKLDPGEPEEEKP